MTRVEWARVCERVAAWWPHSQWPDSAAAAYFDDVAELEAGQVAAAVEALYRDGREFPPNGAQIRSKLLELLLDVPTWPDMYDQLRRAAWKHLGVYREAEAIAELEAWHPLAGELARMVYRDFCTTDEHEVFAGQVRRAWEQLTSRAVRDASYRGIPTSGLRALERRTTRGLRPMGEVLADVLPERTDSLTRPHRCV